MTEIAKVSIESFFTSLSEYNYNYIFDDYQKDYFITFLDSLESKNQISDVE